ncbi:hypothetical protein [Caloramator sp. Dgby_cultured_2]|nr:hypothetical protein [Caloramator sp. Dgby_cultured_2]WDU83782.1 hypothetical protein PWK10_04375 [Caloramator sp. Dgby_cultured_2]
MGSKTLHDFLVKNLEELKAQGFIGNFLLLQVQQALSVLSIERK